jgi:predicted protein tyrosine phosphatase
MNQQRFNILFICSRNRWRSPTAEAIYRKHPAVSVRSAGTSKSARRPVGSGDLAWADLVLVMEDKHKQRLVSGFPSETRFMEIRILDIPDDYTFMDPELIEVIHTAVEPILVQFARPSRAP